ncbi:MAG TPA: hypothetical protein VNT81_11815, partial [Vicinamibacterales bacterium]|nr:hypothetical protein [Vicinamibacterales bacterium]
SEVVLADRMKPAVAPAPPVPPVPALNPQPPASALAVYAGSYFSDEAETVLTAAIEQDGLVLKRRPDTVMRMIAIGPDKFRAPIGTVTFLRNASGAVEGLSVNQERVWDLRFAKR